MILLGCIADDLTGATDLGLTLVRHGMRTIQVSGVPDPETDFGDVDAVVVALKSRTIDATEAVRQSLDSLEVLRTAGAQQIFFKYCSTFDSTAEGNIGPVTEALQKKLHASLTIACPAFPANGRTVYQGHLFVGDQLLSDSPLKDHPLTPMRDPNLVRVLQRQTVGRVGLLPWPVVKGGPDAIARSIESARPKCSLMIADAISDENLLALGEACADHALVTGGSALASGLPSNFRRKGLLEEKSTLDSFQFPEGPTAVLAGSCSAATRQQIQVGIARGFPAYAIDPFDLVDDDQEIVRVCQWAVRTLKDGSLPPLIYTSSSPENVARFQDAMGRTEAGQIVERAHGMIARNLRNLGVSKFIVAGGETSGAVVEALGIKKLEIGPEIAPGVPWTVSRDDNDGATTVSLALKSGNFGDDDLFHQAWRMGQ